MHGYTHKQGNLCTSHKYEVPGCTWALVGISGTTTKSHLCKFVLSSHPGPFVVVASSRKRQTKIGTLTCFDFLKKKELTM